MKSNSRIPETRIESELLEKITTLIDSMQKQTGIQIKISDFVRMALKDFTNRTTAEGLVLKFKFKK
jgi:hypothetical protein